MASRAHGTHSCRVEATPTCPSKSIPATTRVEALRAHLNVADTRGLFSSTYLQHRYARGIVGMSDDERRRRASGGAQGAHEAYDAPAPRVPPRRRIGFRRRLRRSELNVLHPVLAAMRHVAAASERRSETQAAVVVLQPAPVVVILYVARYRLLCHVAAGETVTWPSRRALRALRIESVCGLSRAGAVRMPQYACFTQSVCLIMHVSPSQDASLCMFHPVRMPHYASLARRWRYSS